MTEQDRSMMLLELNTLVLSQSTCLCNAAYNVIFLIIFKGDFSCEQQMVSKILC